MKKLLLTMMLMLSPMMAVAAGEGSWADAMMNDPLWVDARMQEYPPRTLATLRWQLEALEQKGWLDEQEQPLLALVREVDALPRGPARAEGERLAMEVVELLYVDSRPFTIGAWRDANARLERYRKEWVLRAAEWRVAR